MALSRAENLPAYSMRCGASDTSVAATIECTARRNARTHPVYHTALARVEQLPNDAGYWRRHVEPAISSYMRAHVTVREKVELRVTCAASRCNGFKDQLAHVIAAWDTKASPVDNSSCLHLRCTMRNACSSPRCLDTGPRAS